VSSTFDKYIKKEINMNDAMIDALEQLKNKNDGLTLPMLEYGVSDYDPGISQDVVDQIKKSNARSANNYGPQGLSGLADRAKVDIEGALRALFNMQKPGTALHPIR